MDRCPICGTKLIETEDKRICPNHGIITEETKEEEGGANYIG